MGETYNLLFKVSVIVHNVSDFDIPYCILIPISKMTTKPNKGRNGHPYT